MAESDRPRLCPVCKTLVGIKATKCYNCGANLNFSLSALNLSLKGLLPTESPVTWSIFVVCAVLFALSVMATIQQGGSVGLMSGLKTGVLVRLGSSLPIGYLSGSTVDPDLTTALQGQWWRLVTANFLHGGILHILMNMWVLLDLGRTVEEEYGSARYLFVFVATGICGFLLSSLTGHLSIGASASICGLLGAVISLTSKRTGWYNRQMRSNYIKWALYLLLIGFIVPGVDTMAHIGGFVAGFLFGRLMKDRPPSTPQEIRLANALGWGTAIIVIACFVLMIRFYFESAKWG